MVVRSILCICNVFWWHFEESGNNIKMIRWRGRAGAVPTLCGDLAQGACTNSRLPYSDDFRTVPHILVTVPVCCKLKENSIFLQVNFMFYAVENLPLFVEMLLFRKCICYRFNFPDLFIEWSYIKLSTEVNNLLESGNTCFTCVNK